MEKDFFNFNSKDKVSLVTIWRCTKCGASRSPRPVVRKLDLRLVQSDRPKGVVPVIATFVEAFPGFACNSRGSLSKHSRHPQNGETFTVAWAGRDGAGERDRTADLLITNQPL